MKDIIIGRKKELKELEAAFQSNVAEFIALYGRRRVGKTYLIRTFFSEQQDILFFYVTGTKDGSLKDQIRNFTDEIGDKFIHQGARIESPTSWHDALRMLTGYMRTCPAQKIVLFFDEFPWMVSKRSGLMEAFQYYWNRHWSMDPRIKLIICGSSAGWIIKRIINNRAGLYNRVSRRIHLEPFELHEAKEYLKYCGVSLNERDIVDLYMVLGGIPFYLLQVKPGLSAKQNIEALAFGENSFLMTEFENLYATLFEIGGGHRELARLISQHRYGIALSEIADKAVRYSRGGRITSWLADLEQAGFISRFTPYGSKRKGVFFKMEDEYSLFYFYWIEPIRATLLGKGMRKGYWEQILKGPAWRSWAGYAFEALCVKHISQISESLGLSPSAIPATWRYVPKKGVLGDGAQIDLLFDRDDNAITVCEIKYSKDPFVLDKSYMQKLNRQIDVFKKRTKTKKNIFIAFVSAQGLKKTLYAEEFVHNIVELSELFKKV